MPIERELTHQGYRRGAAAFVLGSAVVALSCSGGLEPCAGVEKGAQVEVTVVGPPSSATGGDPCLQDWGFSEGTSFVATIVRLSGDEECKSGVPELDGPGDWTWELDHDATSRGAGITLRGRYTGRKGACRGTLSMSLSTGDGFPCDASATDEDACTLQLLTDAAAGYTESCPVPCGGILPVRAVRL